MKKFPTLSTNDIEKIMTDVMLGKPSRIKGKEANAFRKEFEKEVEFAKENGMCLIFRPILQVI